MQINHQLIDIYQRSYLFSFTVKKIINRSKNIKSIKSLTDLYIFLYQITI